ncbi:hypothetical protein CLIB1423_02S05754 [[Candida] railenensis]|uniref:Ubiquitin-like protease family profile domain-containing protein n=1 Tax=[Candida] railenensis TaxID=45579 RepID=A0A9P0QLF5_9ASCO|nr:hypothetical protein CLIB1423_02S05754 [[Candida] railenensis]
MIGYDARTGYYNSRSGFVVNFESDQISSGLDLLPWDSILEEESEPDEDEEEKEKAGHDSPKKLTKQQKKEIRQNKKINAARKRKLKRESELKSRASSSSSSSSSSASASNQLHVLNHYEITSNIKNTYNKLIQLLEKEHPKEKGKSSDQKFLQFHSVALYKSDLTHLLPDEWLCDNNIAFMYEVIANGFLSSMDFPHEISLLNPSLVQLFLHMPYDPDTPDTLETMLPVKELSRSKFLFLPMNYIDDFQSINMEEANNGDHWFLAVLSLLDNRLYVYDSMSSDDDDDSLLVELTKRLQTCKSIVKRGKIDVIKVNCQQQDNFDDCGIFLIMFTCVIINRLIRLTHSEEEEGERDADPIITLDISKVKLEPLLGRLSLLNLILKYYKIE